MVQATFKPFDPGYADAIVTLMQDFYAIDDYPIDLEVSKGLISVFIQNESLGRGWVLVQNGQIVGYFILTFIFSFEYKGRIAFLDELYIIPEARGNGLAKQAIDFMYMQAKELSIKIIYLEVEGHNQAARALYLSKNFILHNRGLMKLVVE